MEERGSVPRVRSGVGDSQEHGRPLLCRRNGYRYLVVVSAVGQRGLLPRYQPALSLSPPSGSCTDSAGNSTQASISAFKFDDTNPAPNPVVSPNPVQLNCSATVNANPTDGTSGVNQASVRCGSVDASSVGANKSVSCSVADNAGNTYSVAYGNGFLGIEQPAILHHR